MKLEGVCFIEIKLLNLEKTQHWYDKLALLKSVAIRNNWKKRLLQFFLNWTMVMVLKGWMYKSSEL